MQQLFRASVARVRTADTNSLCPSDDVLAVLMDRLWTRESDKIHRSDDELKLVEWLVLTNKAAAGVNAVADSEQTALKSAVECDDIRSIDLLLRLGADPNL